MPLAMPEDVVAQGPGAATHRRGSDVQMVGTQVGLRHRSNLLATPWARCLYRGNALRTTPARRPRPADRRRHRANHEAHHCPTQGRPQHGFGMTPEGLPMAKVIYEKRDQIAYITLNRPEVHNAIDTETEELLV